MSETSSRFLRALGNLVLAMINATLILVVLCLILGVQLANRVEGLADSFAQNLVSVDPLRADIQGMTGELAALRGDLVAVGEQSGNLTSETAQVLMERIDVFEARIEEVQAQFDSVQARVADVEFDPKAVVDHAIETAASEFAVTLGQFAGCILPASGNPKPSTEPAIPAEGQ